MEKVWYYSTKVKDFIQAELVEERRNMRVIKELEGPKKGKLTGVHHEKVAAGIYPRIFKSVNKPEVWRYKNRLLKINTREDFVDKYLNRGYSQEEAEKQADTDLSMVPKVDDSYEFQQEITINLIDSILNGDHTILTGEKGGGKTSVIQQIAARINQPVIRINMNGETRISDFLGKLVLDGNKTYYSYGVLPRVIKHDYWLINDEIDMAEPNILSLLHPVVEKNGVLVLKENDGEVLELKDAIIFGTANTIGIMQDREDAYAGNNQMNEAFLSRWNILFVQQLDPKVAKRVIRKRFPHIQRKAINQIFKFHELLNDDNRSQNLEFSFDTRCMLSFAEKLAFSRKPWKAAEMTFLNKLSFSERAVVEDLFKIAFGQKKKNY